MHLMDAASDALEAGRLIEPEGESVLHLYRQIVEIDPSHMEAVEHSRQIVRRYAELIRQDLNREALDEADRKVRLLLAAAPESTLVQQLRREVEVAMDRLSELPHLLHQAQQDIAAGRLVSPRGENALSRFWRVLEIESDNDAAKRGIETILEHYVSQAKNRLGNGDLEGAASDIENIALVDPKYAGLENLRDKLEVLALNQQQERMSEKGRPDIEIINEMVDRFKATFEARDVSALHNMSVFPPDHEVFPQQVFSQFIQFRLDISEVEYIRGEHKGVARVSLVDLVEVGGDPLPMPGPWSRFEIVIQKNVSGEWKIFWLMPNF